MPKILLVEDNELNRDMLTRRLEKRGYQIINAPDAPAGLTLAREDGPDLILMDMSLPGLDGWEASRQLKASPSTAKIPLIAITAHAMAEDRAKALAAGCDEFATKPIEFPELLAKIKALLDASVP